MPSLSKIDANLLTFKEAPLPRNIVTLSLGKESAQGNGGMTAEEQVAAVTSQSSYAGSLQLSNDSTLYYHLSQDSKQLVLYTAENCIDGRTLIIQLPQETMHMQHTMTFSVHDRTVLIHMILRDGMFLSLRLPTDYILDTTNTIRLNDDWFKVQSPYDFTVRVPHLLFEVSTDLLMVFLNDGGLLGLRSVSADQDLEPLLFNDNSYLKSLTSIFHRGRTETLGKAVSCTLFQQRYLIVLTENYYLKVWDLTTFAMVKEYNLSHNLFGDSGNTQNNNTESQMYGEVGTYLTLFENYLSIYSPHNNGVFQICALSIDQQGGIEFDLRNIVNSSLSSSSVWFLADMKLIKPLDINYTSSYLNLVVLWKSGSLCKLQVLNFLYDDLKDYQWVDNVNKSLADTRAQLDIASVVRADGETDDQLYYRCMFNLRSRYSPQVFKAAEDILSANNIVITRDNTAVQREEYLANFETILKDVKGKMDEVSTLTILNDEIILVNTLTPFNHSLYKSAAGRENYYFNLYNSENTDNLAVLLRALNAFMDTLPVHTVQSLSDKFLQTTTGEVSNDLIINEKFLDIFKTTLANRFDVANLQALMGELNKLDIIALLDDVINDYLATVQTSADYIESITTNVLSKVATLESLYQMVSIQNTFVVFILMAFVLLDADFTAFTKQLNTLLEINYKQSLFLKLYKQNKLLLIDNLFAKATEHQRGVKLFSYSDWVSFVQHNLSEFYAEPIEDNTFFLKSLEKYIMTSDSAFAGSDAEVYLRDIGSSFYLRNNESSEFLHALLLFASGEYDQSFKRFQMFDGYKKLQFKSLPSFLQNLESDPQSGSIWTPLIKTLVADDHREPRFYYALSCLYSDDGRAPELALRAIKRSIDISLSEPGEIDIITKQHEQLLAMLIHFKIYDEVVDVLRLGHAYLTIQERYTYFESLLSYPNHSDSFFSTLVNICRDLATAEGATEGLNYEDYTVVDSILSQNLSRGDWESSKKLYTFRYVNNFHREAAEAVFNYCRRNEHTLDLAAKKKYSVIIINILSTFEHDYDQWILDGTNVITLGELREQYAKL
ncbi:Nup120 protein [Maudiozyma humilis]|uniref:Nup120 protein n=1 Tax=Maudiozyma humilis TaxID=51915 RepID=A0AAV5S530_MAUHU|nr:Nup120 protein [Kazachstania humilis]